MCLSRWRRRTISYRDCYYRGAISRYLDYPGFPVTDAAVRAATGYFFARAAQQTLQQSDDWKFARFARLIYSPAVELGRLRTIHPSEVLMTVNSPWEESLDALAAAPAQHRLLFENAHVRAGHPRGRWYAYRAGSALGRCAGTAFAGERGLRAAAHHQHGSEGSRKRREGKRGTLMHAAGTRRRARASDDASGAGEGRRSSEQAALPRPSTAPATRSAWRHAGRARTPAR